MRFSILIASMTGVLGHQYVLATAPATSSASASSLPLPFSANFHQPAPPTLQPEFKANWKQHKWNVNVSHIASGFIYTSPSQGKIRIDEAYDGDFASSLFDFTDVANNGSVKNVIWSLAPSIASPPTLSSFYVEQPAFVLFSANMLASENAVYAGVGPYHGVVGPVSQWNIMYAGSIPVTIYVDENGIVQRYDFWANNERTYVITEFFNIEPTKIDSSVFDFPKA